MLAIVETGGKQYEVVEGRYVDVELLEADLEESLTFDKVVMIMAGESSQVGQPYVADAVVKAKVLTHGKTKKVLVYKQRCKKGYRKKQGHRQNFTRVMIESIDFPEKETVLAAEAKAVKAEKPAKAKKTSEEPKKAKAAKAEKKAPKAEVKAVEEVKETEVVETTETAKAVESEAETKAEAEETKTEE